MDAFSDHGSIAQTITNNVEAARAVLHALECVGIDMTAIADQLEAEGVVSFQQSFNDLLAVLEAKSK
jgi:transaldolase/glucose-6-phosphate isomerase